MLLVKGATNLAPGEKVLCVLVLPNVEQLLVYCKSAVLMYIQCEMLKMTIGSRNFGMMPVGQKYLQLQYFFK